LLITVILLAARVKDPGTDVAGVTGFVKLRRTTFTFCKPHELGAEGSPAASARFPRKDRDRDAVALVTAGAHCTQRAESRMSTGVQSSTTCQ
jgi:hypothetical protein